MSDLTTLAGSKRVQSTVAARQCIDEHYPPYRQANIERLAPTFGSDGEPDGSYTEADRSAMWAFIDAVRARNNLISGQIDALVTTEDPAALAALTPDYSDLLP